MLGAGVGASLVLAYASQSLPLRSHHEMAGSWEAAEAIADIAGGEQGVFLYTKPESSVDPMRNTPAMVWFAFDQVTARLQPDYDIDEIDSYQRAFPDQPVFLVTHGDLPSHLPPGRFTNAGAVTEEFTMWEESVTERPDEAVDLREDLAFWRLES